MFLCFLVKKCGVRNFLLLKTDVMSFDKLSFLTCYSLQVFLSLKEFLVLSGLN